jgi:hypothetical protein
MTMIFACLVGAGNAGRISCMVVYLDPFAHRHRAAAGEGRDGGVKVSNTKILYSMEDLFPPPRDSMSP